MCWINLAGKVVIDGEMYDREDIKTLMPDIIKEVLRTDSTTDGETTVRDLEGIILDLEDAVMTKLILTHSAL